MRSRFSNLITFLVLIIIWGTSGCVQRAPMAGQGIMVGEVTETSALVQVRITAGDSLENDDLEGVEGLVEFVLINPGNDSELDRSIVKAAGFRDFISRAFFEELSSGTRYQVRTRIGKDERSLVQGPTASFKTLAGKGRSETVQFVVVAGMNYAKFHGDNGTDRGIQLQLNPSKLAEPYSGPDKHLGYPGLETILKLKPDFFIGTGDNVYYDTPQELRAETVTEMRQKWHEQFVQPRFRDLFAEVPTYWEVNDHDYRINDCDNTGDYHPTPGEARRMFLGQVPVAPAGQQDVKTYRTYRVTKDLQIWFVENRMHRSPNGMPDGPDKSIWGAEQKQWLKRTLLESDAAFKLLISPTPMVGPGSYDNDTHLNGFRHERDEFFAWLKKTGLSSRNFFVACGDTHSQYHSISPEGIEEFSTGALTDTNSQPGLKPGDPKSTDPDGLVNQAYLQNPHSGGFLLVNVTPGSGGSKPTLSFDFRDEQGVKLYSHKKQ